MTKQEIISHFYDFYDQCPHIDRFVIVELREKQYALFNKRDFIAYNIVDDKIDKIDEDVETLFCAYLDIVENITFPMFQSFEDIVKTIKKPTVCLFFAKYNDTYKCGVFALEEPSVESEALEYENRIRHF